MKKLLKILIVTLLIPITSFAQTTEDDLLGRDSIRTITTAVPFLTISPDARSGGLAETGVAISPDANAIHWNPAKLPFLEQSYGAAVSYTPWLRKIINDMSLNYLAGYYKVTKERVISLSLLYFDLGEITFTDINGQEINTFNPKEYAITAGYAMKLSKYLGVGVNLRYVHSNLTGQIPLDAGTQTKPGNTAAGDVAVYYNRPIIVSAREAELSFGANISNVGAKISYTNNDKRDFIPANMKLGAAFKIDIDEYQNVMFTFDVNKLLVPSPTLYVPDKDGNDSIIGGPEDPDQSVASGIFSSFGDAAGGFKEEMQEFILSGGIEYWYDDLLAFRAGYFTEHRFKGNRKFITVGFGLRYQMLGIDAAYLIPLAQNNPLAETIRLSLMMNFSKQEGAEESIME